MKIIYNHKTTLTNNKIAAIISAILAFQNMDNGDTHPSDNYKLNKWQISLIENSILNNKWTNYKW